MRHMRQRVPKRPPQLCVSPHRNIMHPSLPPHRAHCPAWRLALSLLHEWMGVALVTSNEAVVTAPR